jgi:hypothetical protein
MFKLMICFVCLISISAFAENVSFKLEDKDLKVVGQIASKANKPILINGFDLAGTPYKLEVTRESREKGLLNVGYILERNGAKQSGNISTEKGKLAKIENKQIDTKNSGLIFEATISE